MGALTREQILAGGRRDVVRVNVPEMGGEVCLRPLSGAEISDLYADETADRHKTTQAIVAMSICDDDGNRLFTATDAPALYDKAYAAIRPLIEKVMQINRLTVEAQDQARKA